MPFSCPPTLVHREQVALFMGSILTFLFPGTSWSHDINIIEPLAVMVGFKAVGYTLSWSANYYQL